jgi:FkbM family methyltransferase
MSVVAIVRSLGALIGSLRPRREPGILIGGRFLPLQLDNVHEIAYQQKQLAGIDDVDVAIARRLLRPGDIALDLGANIGYVSLHMLAIGAAEVHAFEPNPRIFSRLARLRGPRLHCHPQAVGARRGEANLILSTAHHQGSTLYPQVVALRRQVFGEQPMSVPVAVCAIDELFPDRRFDYVKVDVEGGELDVVAGARELLSRRPPRVLELEIKPEFKRHYLDVLGTLFSHARRVDYDPASGAVRFVAVDAEERPPFLNRPPNYVFTNDPATFASLPGAEGA